MDTSLPHPVSMYDLSYRHPISTSVSVEPKSRIRIEYPNSTPPPELLTDNIPPSTSGTNRVSPPTSLHGRLDPTFFQREEDQPDLFTFPVDLEDDEGKPYDPFQWFKYREFPIDPKLYSMMGADIVDKRKVVRSLPKPALHYDPMMFSSKARQRFRSGSGTETESDAYETDASSESMTDPCSEDDNEDTDGGSVVRLGEAINSAKKELANMHILSRNVSMVALNPAQSRRSARAPHPTSNDDQTLVCTVARDPPQT